MAQENQPLTTQQLDEEYIKLMNQQEQKCDGKHKHDMVPVLVGLRCYVVCSVCGYPYER